MRPELTYLFRKFNDQVLNPDDPNDPTVVEIRGIAAENRLTVAFRKIEAGRGGACVEPPRNQVTIALIKGLDNQWRVFI